METKELVKILSVKKLKIATAESCTGGLLAKKITDVSGASNVFEFGIVSYSNRIKNEFLAVSNDILEEEGAVSEETAKQMAREVAKLGKADIGVGITGFAGPTGDEVGLVYVSVYFNNNDMVNVKRLMLNGGRDKIREKAADISIKYVLDLLMEVYG